ncbi:DNA-binding protein [Clostridium botulinum]|nr:DNA-binding protein [Clostridium botulinum]NFC90758.1 DNA-binding protein [Clostridium botulinum]NFC99643.1 DNA-binding protein [Clostridium botulinum]NFD38488.1 DNA-binding protein [Clostridium botulinum]NFD42155.1 DNA-binding protein [Clostridium botulinum]
MAKPKLSNEASKYERIIADLVRLQFIVIRYLERNTNIKYITHRDLENVLTGGRPTLTYSKAIDNLLKHAKMRIHDKKDIIDNILELKNRINDSEIKELHFGMETSSHLEYELDQYLLRRTFFMITSMLSIKDAAELLGITESAIKQACQQERLLNTEKIGRNWRVHLPECRAYWNIPYTDEKDNNYDLKY